MKRARASIARQLPADAADPPLPASQREQDLVARFIDAYERGDVGAVVSLLTSDAKLTMPPEPFVCQGHTAIGGFLAVICAPRRFRLIPTRANGQPVFGCYLRDGASARLHAHGLLVITLAGDQVSDITRFLDNSVLPAFGLPRHLQE